MKKFEPVNIRRLFLLPLFLIFLFSTFAGFLTYYLTVNRFKSEMIVSGTLLSETLSESMTNNLNHKQDIIDSIESLLVSVGMNVIDHRDSLSNEYLNNLVNTFLLTDIWWFNEDGVVIYDANDLYIGWTAQVGDPIHHFMVSGLDVLVDDIRKGSDEDRYYKIAYVRAADGYFVEIGCKADVIYELTEDYEYQSVIENLIIGHSSISSALVLDANYLAIADTNVDDIGIIYLDNGIYERSLLGETIAFEGYDEKTEKDILKIATPIYDDDEIIGLLEIGFDYDNFFLVKAFLISIFVALILGVLLFYVFSQMFQIVLPLRRLSASIKKIDIDHIEYRSSSRYKGVFAGMQVVISDLVNKIFEKNQESKQLVSHMRDLAYTDQLTQLPNRLSIINTLDKNCIMEAKAAIIFIDIDDFKTINDTKGHLFGDIILKEIAENLSSLKTDHMFISRYQGDEFLFILNFNDVNEIYSLIESIQSLFSNPIIIDDSQYFIEICMGISICPDHGTSSDDLLRKADIAMYEAKIINNVSYKFYDSVMEDKIESRNKILNALKNAIKNDGFSIAYQPQVNIETNQIIGLEALSRLTNTNISPSQFIPIAEQNRLISKIGRIVIEKVIFQQAKWKDLGLEIVPVYVNFSAYQLDDQNINEFIMELLEKNNIPPGMLGIEITESVMIEKSKQVIETITEMKKLGLKTAIDDFGSGQTGINYLTNFEVDMVKFDKSFSDKYLNKDKMKVYKSVIDLSEQLGFVSLAEGIEREEQIILLKKTNCKLVQGYFYYRPTNPEQIFEILSLNSRNQ